MSANGCEVLVIGEGLSGITAAATAASHGAHVTLASKGPGNFVLGAACVSVDGLETGKLGDLGQDELDAAITFFLNLTSSAQCAYSGSSRERRLVPTILGTFQKVSLAPRSLWLGDPRSVNKVVVVGIANMPGFDANFVAERLFFYCREMGLSTSYRSEVVTLPHNPKHALTAMEVATHIDRDASYRGALIHALRPVVKGEELLIIPGILGVKSGDSDIVCFGEEIGCPVCELATLPPSVPGLRILQRLEFRLAQFGVEICTGFPVQKLIMDGNHCIGADLETPGHPRRLHADEVILACGRFSHLLESLPTGLTSGSSSLAANVFLCGSLLGQVEPRHRNAISILTGHQAGLLASRQGVQYAGR